MKRIFIIVPIVFCIILSAFPIMSVSAASYPNDLQTVTEMAESVDSRFKTLQECLLDLGNPDTYVYFRIAGIDGDDGDKMIYTYFSTLAVEGLDVTEEDNVYTFSYSSSGSNGLKFCRVSDYAYNNSDNFISDQHAVTIGDPYSGNNAFISCSSCSLDLNTMKCSIIDDIYDEKYYIIGEPEIVVDGVKLNDDGLEVSFEPILSGTLGMYEKINGKDYANFMISMYAVNHSKTKNYQFAWFITQNDSVQGVHGEDKYGHNYTNGYGFFGNVDFAYITKEWNYVLTNNEYIKVYSPCSWHWIQAGSFKYYNAPFSAMKLEKGKTYNCLVYAVETHCDCTSNINYSLPKDNEPFVDFDNVQLIYSSTFTMPESTNFDPKTESFGIIPWDSSIDNSDLFDKSSAYYNDSGELVIDDGSLSIGIKSGSSFYRSKNYNNLISETSDVFSFVTSILSRFPTGFLQIFNIGFWSLLIIAIIRRVH